MNLIDDNADDGDTTTRKEDDEEEEIEKGEMYGWLEEVEMPEDSEMDGIEYLGPQIMDTNF